MLPDFFANFDQLSRVLLSVVFVLIAAVVSRWQHADLERDLAIATVRSFIQLILIGYALELIFNQDNPIFILIVLAIMITIAAHTSSRRIKHLPAARRIALISISAAALFTVGTLLLLGVFKFVAQDVIPIGGMIIGNTMNVTTLVMTRLYDDLQGQRLLIESKLALGATSRQASQMQFRRALRSAMTPMIDTTKNVGLITLPGAMTGMILAGASPLLAVQLQFVVMYMLIGATTFAGLISAYLTYQQFFTPEHQLRFASASDKS
jgi:putative ABC transport system permease protein